MIFRRISSRYLFLLVLFLGIGLGDAALGQTDLGATFPPADARLHEVATSGDPNLHLWRGELALHGILSVAFDRSVHSEPVDARDLIEVKFVPDEESINTLPRATGSYAAPIRDLYVSGEPAELLRALIGAQQSKAVLTGSAIRYEWPVELTVTQFSASIECDHRTYGMEQNGMKIDAGHLNAAYSPIE